MKKVSTQEIWLEGLKSEQTNFGNAYLLTRNMWFRTRENIKRGDLVMELDPKNKMPMEGGYNYQHLFRKGWMCKKGSKKERKRRIRSTNT